MNRIKKLFETPLKASISTLGIVAVVALLGAGSVFAADTIAETSSIGSENARNFAFADAGVDPVTAKVVRTEFDFEQGKFVYEIDFIAGGMEYEYQVKADDGAIVKRAAEPLDADDKWLLEKAQGVKAEPQTKQQAAPQAEVKTETKTEIKTETKAETKQAEAVQPQSDAVSGATPQGGSAAAAAEAEITLEDAKKAALSDAGVAAADAVFTKAYADYDDGIAVYEIEFYVGSKEYDYEINAVTGAVYSKDFDIEDRYEANMTNQNTEIKKADTKPAEAAGAYIGVDKAKAAAAAHAGLNVADVTFSKAKLENDDGYTVYEIEFYKDGVEYEYTINAADATVMEYDSDWDD